MLKRRLWEQMCQQSKKTALMLARILLLGLVSAMFGAGSAACRCRCRCLGMLVELLLDVGKFVIDALHFLAGRPVGAFLLTTAHAHFDARINSALLTSKCCKQLTQKQSAGVLFSHRRGLIPSQVKPALCIFEGQVLASTPRHAPKTASPHGPSSRPDHWLQTVPTGQSNKWFSHRGGGVMRTTRQTGMSGAAQESGAGVCFYPPLDPTDISNNFTVETRAGRTMDTDPAMLANQVLTLYYRRWDMIQGLLAAPTGNETNLG
ncbi:hypothetical protein BJ741DRAFT_584289 [Chytriomyces cf. hyalinus JEL632]|nr:hypothetical protein BJ741DRAFT_584289 [Chytriomyces cf. hyalinus JEL632]